MDNSHPESPSRSFAVEINIPMISLPEPLATAFAHCSAEAQMLEHAIKSAVTKDVRTFAKPTDQLSFLEILERVTLGQAKGIVIGTPHNEKAKDIAACVGFFEFVKMQWSL